MDYNGNNQVKQGRIKLPIPNCYRFERIENILFCEAIKNYTKIYMISGKKFLVEEARTFEFDGLEPKSKLDQFKKEIILRIKITKNEIFPKGCPPARKN